MVGAAKVCRAPVALASRLPSASKVNFRYLESRRFVLAEILWAQVRAARRLA